MARSSRRARRSRGPCSSFACVASAATAPASPSAGPTGAAAAAAADGYARGARILSVGIASTGLFTFAYFAVASHVLASGEYGAISLLWSVLFVVISIIYRPVEQLLSRTIAERRARGLAGAPPPRGPRPPPLGR